MHAKCAGDPLNAWWRGAPAGLRARMHAVLRSLLGRSPHLRGGRGLLIACSVPHQHTHRRSCMWHMQPCRRRSCSRAGHKGHHAAAPHRCACSAPPAWHSVPITACASLPRTSQLGPQVAKKHLAVRAGKASDLLVELEWMQSASCKRARALSTLSNVN